MRCRSWRVTCASTECAVNPATERSIGGAADRQTRQARTDSGEKDSEGVTAEPNPGDWDWVDTRHNKPQHALGLNSARLEDGGGADCWEKERDEDNAQEQNVVKVDAGRGKEWLENKAQQDLRATVREGGDEEDKERKVGPLGEVSDSKFLNADG